MAEKAKSRKTGAGKPGRKTQPQTGTGSRSNIILRGARVNNLKNIDLDIPRGSLTVVTGVSGSGKSSLAFDTLYAEGQRRYVESLSAYARQFLERMNKPDVDLIQGIGPAIAIEQKPSSRNPRSTVGTATEVYDYLRLLYARIGRTICRNDGLMVQRDSVRTVIDRLGTLDDGERFYIVFPMHAHEGHSMEDEIDNLRKQGFLRLVLNGEVVELDDVDHSTVEKCDVMVLVDRIVWRKGGNLSRLSDSLETAFMNGDGHVRIIHAASGEEWRFSRQFECAQCHTAYREPEPRLFSFNNPAGACPECQGFGRTTGIDPRLVIPDQNRTIAGGAVQPWTTPKHSKHQRDLLRIAPAHGVPVNVPYRDLSAENKRLVWDGTKGFLGVNGFFRMVEEKNYKMHYRILMARYRGYTTCRSCDGSRLSPDALAVKVLGRHIGELTSMTITALNRFFAEAQFTEFELDVAGRILEEIRKRVGILDRIGLGYITLDRLTHTLSGGEAQRINIATALGSALVGTMYVLDEPTIGLHQRDNTRLIEILRSLKDAGNTVIVVEHDADMMRSADYIVDLGPGAGESGGSIMFAGTLKDAMKCRDSLTGNYLAGKLKIPVPAKRRKPYASITIKSPRQNNLKGMDVRIPLGVFTCVTGVSGSGKSTLITDILFSGLKKDLEGVFEDEAAAYDGFAGVNHLKHVEMVDQSPIGRTPRSNPVTFIKVFDVIRDVFASTSAARLRGLTPGSFSFNVPGGRCDDCEGDGFKIVEMQFMADVMLECETCHGTRYKKEVLDIHYNGKSIVDVLNMTVLEALKFFDPVPRITNRLQVLDEVGLGYMKLGQSATTLSGGEAQRLKLAAHLQDRNTERTLFIFDEPTTGLHIHDIRKLLLCFNALVDAGHSVLIIEHNLDVIKCADWIIDLGPEGGDEGGEVVCAGRPEEVALCRRGHTGRYLKEMLDND
jgi:excinuclease ABC subunit A